MERKQRSKSNYFIDNDEFLRLIVKYQSGKLTKRENRDLGNIILKLVDHYSTKPNFCRYTYLDEMKSNAYYTIWKGIKSFNAEISSNPFSYFTTACHRAFIFIINKEKKTNERDEIYGNANLKSLELKPEHKLPAKKKWTREINNNAMNY